MPVIKAGNATAFSRYNTKLQEADKIIWVILAKHPIYLQDR